MRRPYMITVRGGDACFRARLSCECDVRLTQTGAKDIWSVKFQIFIPLQCKVAYDIFMFRVKM